jgi:hypothetical protein
VRFLVDFSAVQSIATSHARDDAGVFELSFRDERYVPFEGAGAVSEWRLDLPKTSNAFDFDTITDVVLKINYTAREGGDLLRSAARQAAILPALTETSASSGVAEAPPGQPNLRRLFGARHELPSAWHAFLYPSPTVAGQVLIVELSPERFPFAFRGRRIQVNRWELFLKWADAVTLGSAATPPVSYPGTASALRVSVVPPPSATAPAAVAGMLTSDASILNGLPRAVLSFSAAGAGLGPWRLEIAEMDITAIDSSLRTTVTMDGTTHQRLVPGLVEDLVLVCHYAVTA